MQLNRFSSSVTARTPNLTLVTTAAQIRYVTLNARMIVNDKLKGHTIQ
jgi:riboflavin synthase alpha subunit